MKEAVSEQPTFKQVYVFCSTVATAVTGDNFRIMINAKTVEPVRMSQQIASLLSGIHEQLYLNFADISHHKLLVSE